MPASEVPNKAQTDLNGDVISPESFLNFVPESYTTYDANGKLTLNILTLSSALIDQIEEDIASFSTVSMADVLERDFKVSEVFSPARDYYTIRSKELLKSFFQFKGTKQDLQYLIANAGYITTFVEKYDDETVPDCSLIYKVFIDLDSDNFKGYTPELKQRAMDLFASRLFICAYLYGVQIFVTAKDIVDLLISEDTSYKIKLNLTDGVNDNFKADSDNNKSDFGLLSDRQDLWLKYNADEGWFSDTHINLSADGDNRWSYIRDIDFLVNRISSVIETAKIYVEEGDLSSKIATYMTEQLPYPSLITYEFLLKRAIDNYTLSDLVLTYASILNKDVVLSEEELQAMYEALLSRGLNDVRDVMDASLLSESDISLVQTRVFSIQADTTDTLVVLDTGVLDLKYNRLFTATVDGPNFSYIL